MIIECAIVEDEPLATEKLIRFIESVPYLSLVESFDNGMAAIDFLNNRKVDLLFLDIRMNMLNGIDMLKSLQHPPSVIITTAYSEYAIEGFNLDVVDYLLKPYSISRFLQACNKVYEIALNNKVDVVSPKYIFVKTEYRIERVDLEDLLYVEGQGDYLLIVTSKKKIMTLHSFKKLEKLLPEDSFIRVHKSYIISIAKIDMIENSRIVIDSKYIPISNTYKNVFNKIIKGSVG